MLVKTTRGKRSAKRSRHGHGGHAAAPAGAAPQSAVAPRERRHAGPSEDRALYNCECGYIFEAVVTTSVGCPHCERTQAW